MSRFNRKAISALAPQPASTGAALSSAVQTYGIAPRPSPTGLEGTLPRFFDKRPNILQGVCFVVLCAYLLSSYANELAFRLLHGKAYISTVAVVLLPLLFLATGSALRGVWMPFGKWWVAFGLWLAICAPFSVWKMNTFQLLFGFYFRSYLLYFVICACALTLRRVTTLIYVLGIGNFLVVLSCFAYGYFEDGRFSVFGSKFSFLANANELALQLLLGSTALAFFFFRKGKLMKIICIGLIAVASAYMLKTGSRGVLVAALATLLALFLLSRRKVLVAAVTVPLLLVALAVLPSATLHRLTYIAIGRSAVITNEIDESSLASQMQRQLLFWDSVRLTLQNPIVGVGPGEFMIADSNEKEKKGQNGTWRQTHNSYTQVSSEAGLPALIFFVGAMLSCFRLNYRIYRRTAGREGLQDYAGLSFCMLLSMVAFSTGAIFDQLAYTTHLAIIGGITTATYLAAQPILREQTKL